MNVCLIGLGKWGKKLLVALKSIKKIKKVVIIKSRRDKINVNNQNIQWAFISVNTSNHYGTVKKILNRKINVFCEKPLTNNLKDDKKLFRLAKQNKCKLYVSDVENYKNKKINIKKNNIIIRQKYSKNKDNILSRLSYHDFTYLFYIIKNRNYAKLKILKKKLGELTFSLVFDRKNFLFKYSLNSKVRKHKFNKTNLISKKNTLKLMITKIINFQVNFNKNEKISLFANKLSKKINESK